MDVRATPYVLFRVMQLYVLLLSPYYCPSSVKAHKGGGPPSRRGTAKISQSIKKTVMVAVKSRHVRVDVSSWPGIFSPGAYAPQGRENSVEKGGYTI